MLLIWYFSDLIQNMEVIGLFLFIGGKSLSLSLVLLRICGDLWVAYSRRALLSFLPEL